MFYYYYYYYYYYQLLIDFIHDGMTFILLLLIALITSLRQTEGSI